MSKNPLGNRKAFVDLNPKIMDVELARNSLIPMGYSALICLSLLYLLLVI